MSLKSSIKATLGYWLRGINLDRHTDVEDIWLLLKGLNSVRYSVKQQGYAIGRAVFDEIKTKPVPKKPVKLLRLDWKASTQSDVESTWFRYWCAQLQTAPLPHRKLWEYAYTLQNLYHYGFLSPGKKAIGFGCGEEPLPAYFANMGISVTVTDLEPARVKGMGWAESGQHTKSIDSAFHPNLVPRKKFDEMTKLEYVDMNHIPAKLNGQYDFCWSICALEHLGSIAQGVAFIKNSLNCLVSGGVAIHTTEFNYTEVDKTIATGQTVLFLAKHFEELHRALIAEGYEVLPMDCDVGSGMLDAFIDLPPYDYDKFLPYYAKIKDVKDAYRPGHLKMSFYGFPSTCFAITIRKPI